MLQESFCIMRNPDLDQADSQLGMISSQIIKINHFRQHPDQTDSLMGVFFRQIIKLNHYPQYTDQTDI